MGNSGSANEAPAAQGNQPLKVTPMPERKAMKEPKVLYHGGSNNFMETPHPVTGQVIYFHNNKKSSLVVPPNKRCERIIVNDCHDCIIQVQDSVVCATHRLDLINCTGCKILIEVADMSDIRLYNCSNCTFQVDDYPPLTENFRWLWLEGCKQIQFERVKIAVEPGRMMHHLGTVLIQAFDVVFEESTDASPIYTSILRDGVELRTQRYTDAAPQESSQAIIEQVEAWRKEDIMTNPHEFDEIFDNEEQVAAAAKQLASYIREAKHMVVYTGAGISTAAKIPDFRGPKGAWTLRDQGKHAEGIDVTLAVPTFSHFAITELYRRGIVKLVISTNMDSLHRRSGLPEEGITELHGNTYREVCATCRKEYMREFAVTNDVTNMRTHLTGRKCACGGDLRDTIIHFTENMPDREWNLAVQNGRAADLALVLGTSMFVHPAASLPEKALRSANGKLAIINLQNTPYNKVATLMCHAKTDDMMQRLMKELGIEVSIAAPLAPSALVSVK